MDNRIETDRLIVRRWCAEDIEPYAKICADPEVMAFIGDGATRTFTEAADQVAKFEAMWEQNRYGIYAIELRDSSSFLGFTGFADPSFLPDLLPSVEIGWRLGKPFWGNGYATEAAQAVLSAGIRSKMFTGIVSICQAGNIASSRVMQKLGLKFDRRSTDPTCGRDVLIYRLSRTPKHEPKR